MDEEVCNLLKEWGLENYICAFQENAITSMSLPLLGATEIRELIPVIGHRVIFTRNLEEWRKAMHPNAVNPSTFDSQEISVGSSQNQSEISFALCDLLPEYNDDGGIQLLDSTVASPVTTKQNLSNEVIEDLRKLLESSLDGKGILSTDTNNPLENKARLRLVRIICTHILKTSPERNITAQIYGKWANEIVHLFPLENRSVYFHNKIVESSRGIINRLAGKLPDHVHNLKRKYRETGIITKRQRSLSSSPTSSPKSIKRLATALKIGEQEELSDSNLEWLRNSSHPWNKTEEKWEKTTCARLHLLKDMSISQYFDEYPALKNVLGYKLLEKDFNSLYKENCMGLCENFPKVKKDLYTLARKKLSSKDSSITEILLLETSSEDCSNLGAFLLIPSLLTLSSVRLKGVSRKIWRPSKTEARNGFITNVCSDAEIDEAITLRREKFKQLGLTLQPFILIVGTSIQEISSYFVIVNDTKYLLPTIIEAVDICFKIIFMVNAQYPPESKCTWMFIQKAFFKISTKFDQESTAANTLLVELGII